MSTGAILAGIALLIGVVAYVARPLFERSTVENTKSNGLFGTRSQVTSRRDAIYALIRELDADFQTGKINEKDYQALRQRYVADGVAALKQLDALSSTDDRVGLDAEIEAQVLALRRGRAASPALTAALSSRFCTQCGRPSDPEDRFCGECGTPLRQVAVQ